MPQIKCYSQKQIEDSYMALLSNMILSIKHIGGDVSKLKPRQEEYAFNMSYNSYHCFKENRDRTIDALAEIIHKFFGYRAWEFASQPARYHSKQTELEMAFKRNSSGIQLDLAALHMLGWEGFYELVKQGSIFASFAASQHRFSSTLDHFAYKRPSGVSGRLYGSLIESKNPKFLKDLESFKNYVTTKLMGNIFYGDPSKNYIAFGSLEVFESASLGLGQELSKHRDVKFDNQTLVTWSSSAKKGGEKNSWYEYYHCYDLDVDRGENYHKRNYELHLDNQQYVLPYIFNGKKRNVIATPKPEDRENFVGMVLETLPFYDGTKPDNKIVKVVSVVTGDRFYIPTRNLKYAKNM